MIGAVEVSNLRDVMHVSEFSFMIPKPLRKLYSFARIVMATERVRHGQHHITLCAPFIGSIRPFERVVWLNPC